MNAPFDPAFLPICGPVQSFRHSQPVFAPVQIIKPVHPPIQIIKPVFAPIQIRPFQPPENVCRVCNKIFKSSKTLKYHEKTQHTISILEKKFHCTQCEYKTNVNGSLKKHIQTQHNNFKNKNWKCPVLTCVFETKQKYHLTEHLRQKHQIGSNIKIYSCKTCQYKTYHHGSMKRHIKKHNKPQQ